MLERKLYLKSLVPRPDVEIPEKYFPKPVPLPKPIEKEPQPTPVPSEDRELKKERAKKIIAVKKKTKGRRITEEIKKYLREIKKAKTKEEKERIKRKYGIIKEKPKKVVVKKDIYEETAKKVESVRPTQDELEMFRKYIENMEKSLQDMEKKLRAWGWSEDRIKKFMENERKQLEEYKRMLREGKIPPKLRLVWAKRGWTHNPEIEELYKEMLRKQAIRKRDELFKQGCKRVRVNENTGEAWCVEWKTKKPPVTKKPPITEKPPVTKKPPVRKVPIKKPPVRKLPVEKPIVRPVVKKKEKKKTEVLKYIVPIGIVGIIGAVLLKR